MKKYLLLLLSLIISLNAQESVESVKQVNVRDTVYNTYLDSLGVDTSEREEIKQYWEKKEIEALEMTVERQSSLVNSCYKKFKSKLYNKRGYIKVKFEIKANGKIDKSTIKLISTSITHRELVACILKRVKYFKNFKPAKYSLAKNYVFEKKWHF